MEAIQEAVRRNKVYYCLECGKCTSICPISRREQASSPRLTVEKAIMGRRDELLSDFLLWACLTCKGCSERCPSDVFYAEFIRDIRVEARREGKEGYCSHGEAIQTWMRMMTKEDLKQNRLEWLGDGLRTSPDSEFIYFVGCLPYYDVIFEEIGARVLEIARSAVKILNYLGIEPLILADERCCGHDLLWGGDVEDFIKLAELNLKMLRGTGAKCIITTCPECYRTLSVDYPDYIGDLGMDVLHLSQLLSESLPHLTPHFSRLTYHDSRLTYHDPCRLGRHMGVYDEPRRVIEALGLNLVEMAHSEKSALCCGTSCWTNCGEISKSIQVDRLREAKATGAELLVTACPKCQIHLKCAMKDARISEEIKIEVVDLTNLVEKAMENTYER